MAKWLIFIAATFVSLSSSLVVEGQAQAPQFVLTGVVFVEGGSGGRAWLQEPALTQNQVVTVRTGDSIGPYRLATIHEDRVELDGPSGKVVVHLAGVGGPVTAATPAPPAARIGDAPPTPPAPPGARPLRPVDPNRKKFDFKSIFEGMGK